MLPLRPLGPFSVSAIGLGCMGMSHAYGVPDDPSSIKTLHRYTELGGNFLDTAEIYGPHTNELLLARFLRECPRDRLVIATKFGFRVDPVTNKIGDLDSSPANIRRACEGSLKRLGIDTIDLYYQHRVDPEVPIEDVVGEMARLVAAGKVRALGLSEASAATLRRAAAVHPIAALQCEYSLWTRDVEVNGMLAACRELGTALVAFSPLGRGFLTGAITSAADISPTDWRHTNPRFQQDAIEKNRALVETISGFARAKRCTPAQLALAWVLARGDEVIPIPGTKRVERLEENCAAASIELSAAERRDIDAAFPPDVAAGARYVEQGMRQINR